MVGVMRTLRLLLNFLWWKTARAADTTLAEQLSSLSFRNEGLLRRGTQFEVATIPCGYLEPENVTEVLWVSPVGTPSGHAAALYKRYYHYKSCMDMHGSRTLFLDHLRRASRAAEEAAAQASHAPWWRKRDASDLIKRYLDQLLREDRLRLKADDAAAATEKTQGSREDMGKFGGLAESSTALLPSEHQLSNQTREWWRWVLVRVTGFVEFVSTDEDREEFVREWNPDLFEWAGDYRMNVNEWARLHGIAMAAGQELEYEEAQFWFNAAKPNIVNTTWGSDGLNVNINGELMTEGTFAPYMTHVAPKWHVAVEQGNSRHGRAGMADSMAQDNAIGLGIHGDSGWGFGVWEEKRFVEEWGERLGLDAGFSIGEYARGLLAIPQPGDNSTCWPHEDMLGSFGVEAHQYDGGTVADCCLSCANQAGCKGFTWFGDPAIHGRVLCMKTNDTTFKRYDARNVSGGMCLGGSCDPETCGACEAGAAAGPIPSPSEDLIQDPIVHAFVDFVFTTWTKAWKNVAQSTKAAAAEAGAPIPSVYGNTASPSPIAMMEMPWQDVWWMETGWDLEGPICHVAAGGTDHEIKIAQAAMKGIKSPRIWRDGGLRCGWGEGGDWPNRTTNLAARVYLAESIANDANEMLLEGYDRSMWHSVGEAHNYAVFLASWRSASIDRSRIADGAVLYCLPCVMWRAIGPFSFYSYPGGPDAPENLHERDLATVMGVLDRRHAAFEVVVFDHPRFYNNSAGLSRLRPPSDGGYEWIILPSTDAISNLHAEIVSKYVRGGGHAILINSGNQSCGTRNEELAWRQHAALADLQANPGLGHVSVIDGDVPEEQLRGNISSAINGTRQTVIVSGAPSSALMNVWRHGAGPMLSVNLVNYDIQHNLTQVSVSVSIAELGNSSKPVARWLSLDFVGNVRSLPVSILAGRLHVTVPEIQTHALLIIASSAEEFQCREAAAQTRLWLQRSTLAYRSHALRQAARENNKNIPRIVQQWAHIVRADLLLGSLQSDTAGLHVDPGWYRNTQTQLQTSTLALQEAMSAIRNLTGQSELKSRTEVVDMCKAAQSCVRALHFNGGSKGSDKSPAGFVPVAVDQVYNATNAAGFLNTSDLLAFDTAKPDLLHRSGIFCRHTAKLRIDLNLEAVSTSSLVLTLVSGYHDLGSQSVLNQSLGVGVNLSSSDCQYKGRPSKIICIRERNAIANQLTSAWTGFASTSVAVAVRAAGDSFPSTLVPCMLGSTGRTPGYFLTRSCRVNISTVVNASSRLQMDVVLAADQGMTGCFGHNCGEFAFAWLLNALVVSPDSRAINSLPERSRLSLAAADVMSATAVREWMWIGPFDGSDGDGLDTDFGIEADLSQWPVPALNKTYAGKAGDPVSWKRYTADPKGSAPYLPLSQLLPERAQNTGAVAFAIASMWSEAGGKATLQCGMSGRGRVWHVTAQQNGTSVVEDRMIFGLTADESKAEVSLAAGWNAFVVKTESTFAADSVTLDGATARASGVTAGKIGVALSENEWSVALMVGVT